MPNPTASLLYISSNVRTRITEFYRHIQAALAHIVAGYDVIIYFWSETKAKNLSKMPPEAASGGISLEWFKQGSPSFKMLSGTTSHSWI